MLRAGEQINDRQGSKGGNIPFASVLTNSPEINACLLGGSDSFLFFNNAV